MAWLSSRRRRPETPPPPAPTPEPRYRPVLGLPADPAAVLQQARDRGARDGRSSAFDMWSFDSGRLPLYLESLRALMPAARTHSRILGQNTRETDLRELRAATAVLRGEQGLQGTRQRRRGEVQGRLEGIGLRIDRLATLEAYRLERRLRYAGPEEELVTPAGGPAGDVADEPIEEPTREDTEATASAAAPEEADDLKPGDPAADDEPVADPPEEHVPVTSLQAGRLAGTHIEASEREFAPRLGRWWKLAVLAALVAVELPIQYVIFSYFHGDSGQDLFFTVVFTIAVALIMVLAPHLSGHFYRRRHTTGTERLTGPLSLSMLLPCGYVAVMLGFLRAKVLLAGTQVTSIDVGDSDGPLPTKLDSFHLNSATIVVMFVALLVLTGAISFLLGVAQDHPFLYAYREALGERTRLDQAVDAGTPALRTAEERVGELIQVMPVRRQQWEQQVEAVPELYRAAALAYLDALGQAMDEPAATEAIARIAARLADEAETIPPAPHPAAPGGPR